MGRGRQKAKHTKIARELKSYSPTVDYNQLERELTGHAHDDDRYAAWADYDSDEANADDYEHQERTAG